MTDLYLAMILLWTLSVVVFYCVSRLSGHLSKREKAFGLISIIGVGTGHVVWFRDSVWMLKCLPFSSVMVLSNWLPLFCAAVAALAINSRETSRLRRYWPTVALSAVAVLTTIHPLIGRIPDCHESWQGEFCMQSSWYSCSAACAATLLKHHGIDATEAEMARACLTRKGTTWQGLYRGLRRKTHGTKCRVLVSDSDIETLKAAWNTPMIISVGIPAGVEVASVYTEHYGWLPGQLHSVILYGWDKKSGLPKIGDPSIGRENWSPEDLNILYRGVAMKLERGE